MAESIPQSIGNEISPSSGSHEIIIPDMNEIPQPVRNEILQPSGSDGTMVNGTGANNTTEDEQPTAGRRCLEMTAKILGSVAMSLSGPIITAGVANKNKSGGGELILFKVSFALALVSFFSGLALLVSVFMYRNVKMTILLGLIIVAIFSVMAGVVVLAISVFI